MSKLSKIFFDPYLFFSIFLISFLGLFFLYSASNGDTSIVLKQFIFVVFGLILMLLVSQPDPDLFRRYALLFLIFSFLLLGATVLFGPEINGAQRWVRIGSFSIQSSEFLKLALPVFLASFLHSKRLPIQPKEVIISLLIIGTAFIVIAKQPDLGTGLIVVLSGLFVLFYQDLVGVLWVGH